MILQSYHSYSIAETFIKPHETKSAFCESYLKRSLSDKKVKKNPTDKNVGCQPYLLFETILQILDRKFYPKVYGGRRNSFFFFGWGKKGKGRS